MKTLKFLSIVVLFALIAGATYATTYNETRYEVKTYTDLPDAIKRIVKDDFVSLKNYFHANNINEMREIVEFEFYIDKDCKIHVLTTNSKNEDASTYVKQLLNDKKICADNSVLNRKYRLKLNLYYYS